MATVTTVHDKIKEFFQQAKPIAYKRGESILRSEDSPQGIFFVEEGFVKMNSLFEDGRELTLNIYKPGTYFPMMWALADIPNTYYFQAMSPLTLRRIPKNSFINFLMQNPEILKEFTVRILVGTSGILNNVQYLLSGDSYHRVVAAVLLFAKRFGQKDGNNGERIIIKLPVTHQDIADTAGITRETASIAVKKLEEKGLVSHHYRKLTVVSFSKLEKESLIPTSSESSESAL